VGWGLAESRALTIRVGVAVGLEDALVEELTGLGLEGVAEEGAVVCRATPAQLRAVHLWSRLAARVSVVLGQFPAQTLEQLGAGVRRLDWAPFVHPHQPLDVHAAARASRLRMKEPVAKKVSHAIADALRGPRVAAGRPPRTPAGVLVRLVQDRAELSIDASGEPLHRRGWRLETAKAPIRENLAAAILHLAGWHPGEPLVDPMCGSGTFAIEAASVSLGIAPGAGRRFAFTDWPSHDARAWSREQPGGATPLDAAAPIWASDRDAGAVRATEANAARARVTARIRVQQLAFAHLQPPAPTGLVVCNPPYGERIARGAGAEGVRDLGVALRARWSGWRFAVLLADARLRGALGLENTELAGFSNGGIAVRLYGGTVP
jgi:putative N6-adenine-specific DNA methylase